MHTIPRASQGSSGRKLQGKHLIFETSILIFKSPESVHGSALYGRVSSLWVCRLLAKSTSAAMKQGNLLAMSSKIAKKKRLEWEVSNGGKEAGSSAGYKEPTSN